MENIGDDFCLVREGIGRPLIVLFHSVLPGTSLTVLVVINYSSRNSCSFVKIVSSCETLIWAATPVPRKIVLIK